MPAITSARLTPPPDRYPPGTVVGAYRGNAWSGTDKAVAPTGAADASATVAADGSLTFSGLTDQISYHAYAAGSGAPVRFATRHDNADEIKSTLAGNVTAPPSAVGSLRPAAKVLTRAQAGHGMTGGVDDATGSPLFGNAYKVTTNGAGAGLFVGAPAVAAYDVTGKSFRFRLRFDDPTRINNLEVYVTTGAGNTFKGSIVGTFVAGQSDWITVPRIPQGAAATAASGFWSIAGGVPTWAGVTQVQVRVQDKSTGPVSMWVEAIELVAEPAVYPNGVFVPMFDDGFDGQIANGVPLLDARGMPASFAPIVSTLAGTNWTVAYLRDRLAKAGWEIGVHAYDKAVHDWTLAPGAVPPDVALADWLAAKNWLRANFAAEGGPDWLAQQPGSGSPVPEGVLLNAIRSNFKASRMNSGHVETAIPADPHRMRSLLFSGDSVANLNIDVDRATAQGGMMIFTMHDVIAGAANGTSNGLPAIGATNLASVLDHVIANGMAVRTLSDALAGR